VLLRLHGGLRGFPPRRRFANERRLESRAVHRLNSRADSLSQIMLTGAENLATMPIAPIFPRVGPPGSVTHVQVAVGARWEEAARVDSPGGPGAAAELTRLLPECGESAVEVFATDNLGCLAFIGVRFVEWARGDVEAVLRQLCDVAFSEGGSLARVASCLSEGVGAPLFGHGCSIVEVGVVDAWKSVGAITLANRSGWRRSDAEAVLLDAASRLPAPPDAVIAVEFGFGTSVPHWVAVEVGRTRSRGEFVRSSSVRVAAGYLGGRENP
jgi:hypothetical protein